jgi:hypothetical protein
MSELAKEEQEKVIEEAEKAPVIEFDYAAKQEEKAAQGGWKPLEDWIADGKDPEEWSDAATFNVRGEFIGKLKAKDRAIDERINNLNKIHEGQLEVQRQELMVRRDAAVLKGGADSLETVKSLDSQINQLQMPVVPQKDPAVTEWEERNPWIDVPGPKANHANLLFSQALSRGDSVPQALTMIDAEMERQFPSQTVEKVPLTEKGSKPGRKMPAKAIAMADVTAEEQKWRKAMPNAWPTDEAFLKAVQDSRASK